MKAKIATASKNRPLRGWLKSAVWNALHDYPVSEKQERRICEALGIAPRKRKTAKRLWIPDDLARQCAEVGMDNEDMRIAIWREYCERIDPP